MDTTKVQMVRSAKNTDMLCVDNYLYHFIDRGHKRCRWVCNRLKSKHQPCRSRIATVIINGDESQHEVVRVTNEHTHERCSEKEIAKVVERKLQANLAGKPCTLKMKYSKGKDNSEEEHDESKRKVSIERRWDGDMESDEWPTDDDDMFTKETRAKKSTSDTAVDSDSSTGGGHLFNFKKQKLYMLRTALGRQMICVEGFLYRLESKSITSSTHRWECIKQDPACKVRILTERLPNGAHRLKANQVIKHCHDGYTTWKLTKLLQKNNITVLKDNRKECVEFQNKQLFESHESVYLPANNTQTSIPPKKRIMDSLNRTKSQESITDTDTPIKAKRIRTKSQPVAYTYSEDPLAAISTSTKKDLNNTKFTFLPSAKGNKVLCLDNYIFHLDTRSPRNGRAYWTCLLRRDKFYKCNARVTTEMTNKGPIIIRVSGKHLHSDHSQDIKRRLCRSFVVQNAEKAGIKVESILNESGMELNDELREIVEESKKVIESKMNKSRNQNENDDNQGEPATIDSKVVKLDDDAVSDISTVSVSDDEYEYMNSNTFLPTKLDEMLKSANEKKYYFDAETVVATTSKISKNIKKQNDSFNKTYEALVEEMTAEDEMEVEYLDINTYTYEEEEKVKNENDYLDGPLSIQDTEDRSLLDKHLTIESEMNLNNVSTLRSAKGGELLCVDGYIYHIKGITNNRKYWACIKSKDPELNCRSRVGTLNVNNEIRVFRTSNRHTHPVIESDIKRRLYNEFKNETSDLININGGPSIDAINSKYSQILGKETSVQNFDAELDDAIGMTMKLYAVSDGPPSLAVRMTLQALKIPYELVNVDFIAGEHMTERYAKMNPQKEIPVLDDDGFYLSESIAIMQYLCDKYAPSNQLYPRDPAKRAIVNHRLCFNMGFYYSAISAHSMAPIFFDYQRTDMSLKKVNNALNVFEIYLRDGGTKYAAAEYLTIADFALVTATICLEAINFDLSPYPLVKKWYEMFKKENSDLWSIANNGMQEIAEFEKNPPDLSDMKHPFHPTRKAKI